MVAVASSLTPSPWSPLRIAIYRSIWLAALVSNIGTFMHLAAAGWAMTLLSDSPTLTGLVQAAWAIPGFALALHAGAYADLIDRRRLILTTEGMALGVAAALAVFQWTGTMSVPVLLVGTFLESVALTLSAPAFMALTPHLVGADEVAPALGLDAISRNIATAVGPALAGVIIATEGPGSVFALNALSFLGIVVVVAGRREGWGGGTPEQAVGAAIGAGLRHIVATAALHRPAIRLALSTIASASVAAVLPLLARNRLEVSANGFGVLSAGLGIGSVAAVWVLPKLRASSRPETAAALSGLVWSLGALLLATSGSLPVAAVGVVLAGAGWMGQVNVLYSNYVVELPDWMRGRGSAAVMLTIWLGTSVGAVLWGWVASATSIGTALVLAAVYNAVAVVVSRLLLRVRVPSAITA